MEFKTREEFEAYWNANYVPVAYDDVKEAYEAFVNENEKKIFLSDYQEKNCISQDDFAENLHEDAQFAFQDALTEVFYDKNPELYEAAFALYEAAMMEDEQDEIGVIFHETFNELYSAFLQQMFDTFYR